MKSGAKDSKTTKAEPKAEPKTTATKTKAQKKPAAGLESLATAPGIGPLGLVPLQPLEPRPESAEPEPGTVTGLPEVDQVGHQWPIGPCTQIVYTLAPKYLYREDFKTKVYRYMDP